jgi:hypothetical protein
MISIHLRQIDRPYIGTEGAEVPVAISGLSFSFSFSIIESSIRYVN